MSVELTWLEAIAAATPIAVILIAMIFLGTSAAVAGVLGMVLTSGLVIVYFGFSELAGRDHEMLLGFGGAFAEAGFTAATILWIIFGALFVHQLQMKTGAIAALRDGIGSVSEDPRLVAILIAWFFALFMEGAAGFGTPVALAAPFLVGFGVPPVQAVAIVLIGHSVGVSFGAIGTPVIPQIAVTEYSGPEIARVTGEYQALIGALTLFFVVVLVTRQSRTVVLELVPVGRWFVLAALAFLVPMWAISRWVGPELPTMAGAIIGGVIFVVGLQISRQFGGRQAKPRKDEAHVVRERMSLWRAASPYAVVIVLVLATRLIGPVKETLQAIELQWTLAGIFEGSFRPLYHPGTFLVLGALLGGLIQGASSRIFRQALHDVVRMLVPVTVALVAMLAISRLMVHGALIDALVEAAAMTGTMWPLVAPMVGVLGTFVTGSATASNILFTDFQVATAERLELDGLRLVGAQGFGAAVGNIICPHNVIAGCATVGIAGREGEVLRHTLGVCLLCVALGGVLTFVWM